MYVGTALATLNGQPVTIHLVTRNFIKYE